MVKLIGGGSVINGAYPVQFLNGFPKPDGDTPDQTVTVHQHTGTLQTILGQFRPNWDSADQTKTLKPRLGQSRPEGDMAPPDSEKGGLDWDTAENQPT